jgi:serine/threonine protein kinase/tetratricopeptide (TPR) repeat protein
MFGQEPSNALSPGRVSSRVRLARLSGHSASSPPTCAAAGLAGPASPIFHSLPEVGAEFLGFHLIAELGRGSFARVFLGRQPDLAGRLVALKVSTEIVSESQKLAQLQHTNIVPVYSLHRSGPLQAVCMPYYGATTLADIVNDLRSRCQVPTSGTALASAIEERRARALASIGRVSSFPGGLRPPSEDATPQEPPANIRRLQSLSHVEAVLWIGACLADGLHHAHERGIVHRDVKPANVLLTDEGVPMLLDFNLADDVKQSGRRGVGGTLAYMAPEHLAAFAGLPAPAGPRALRPLADNRSDLYSLGVILHELLTARHPFPTTDGPAMQMIEERLRVRPQARPHNPEVTPAIESILRRCLHPDPDRRYQSAAHLREDLQAHLAHLPLRHAPERSAAEVVGKWARRNPRLASTMTLGSLAFLALALLAIAVVGRGQRLGRLDALASLAEFRADAATARLCLAGILPDDPARHEGEAAARRALSRYGVLGGPGWESRASGLPPAYREALREEVGELLILMAEVAPPTEALRLNEAAESCHPGIAALKQKARILVSLGRDAEAARELALCQGREACAPTDRFLLARELAAAGKYSEAVKILTGLASAAPGHFGAWLLMGCCHLQMGEDAEADACFTACAALRPEAPAAWRHRGMARLRLGRFPQAEADLAQALARRPDCPAALILRARAREGMGRLEDALSDLRAARAAGGPPVRILLASSRLRRLQGDLPGAARDRAEALKATPDDEEGWVARGVARAQEDPRGALDDFARALALDPRSIPALQNRAHVLAERLGRPREAAAALARILEARPGHALTRASRAVLLARAGMAEALAEAEAALAAGPSSPEVAYHAACAYALMAGDRPDARRRALDLLARALAGGYGHAFVAADPDLDSLREMPEFANLVRAAQALRPGGAP